MLAKIYLKGHMKNVVKTSEVTSAYDDYSLFYACLLCDQSPINNKYKPVSFVITKCQQKITSRDTI